MDPPKSFLVNSTHERIEDSSYAKCPLCMVNRKAFYCNGCIKSGDFKNSSER